LVEALHYKPEGRGFDSRTLYILHATAHKDKGKVVPKQAMTVYRRIIHIKVRVPGG
jgi:hypothetical protein